MATINYHDIDKFRGIVEETWSSSFVRRSSTEPVHMDKRAECKR